MRVAWHWKKKPPMLWTIGFGLLFVTIASGMLLLSNLSHLAQRDKDSAHPIEVVLPRDGTFYLGPTLGWYLHHWVHISFALLVFEVIVAIIYRGRLQRR